MSKKTKDLLGKAKELLDISETKASSGNFAYELQTTSLKAHIDELSTYESLDQIGQAYELVDFRIIAPQFKEGTIPLHSLAKAADEIRKMLGYAALRFIQGGIRRKRIPDDLYRDLDLRLAGVLPGSTRLVIAAAAQRDLLGDGIAKHALDRVMRVLDSEGHGDTFLESVADLGPQSTRSLKELLRLLRSHSGALDLTWSHAGQQVRRWAADPDGVARITSALEVTTVREQSREVLRGVVELLSKRERLHLRQANGELVRILFPKRLLSQVSELHLDQEVSLVCQVTETENELTGETAVHHELIELKH